MPLPEESNHLPSGEKIEKPEVSPQETLEHIRRTFRENSYRAMSEAAQVFGNQQKRFTEFNEAMARTSYNALAIRHILKIWQDYPVLQQNPAFWGLLLKLANASIYGIEIFTNAIPLLMETPLILEHMYDACSKLEKEQIPSFISCLISARMLYENDSEKTPPIIQILRGAGTQAIEMLKRFPPHLRTSSKQLSFFANKLERYEREDFLIYLRCFHQGIITFENDAAFEEDYIGNFGESGFSSHIIGGLLALPTEAERKAYVERLKDMIQRMISSEGSTEEDRINPEFPDLVKHVFTEGNYGSYKDNEKKCKDQKSHLKRYAFHKEGYDGVLTGVSGYKVREGNAENTALLGNYQDRLHRMRGLLSRKDFEQYVHDLFIKYANPEFASSTHLSLKEKIMAIIYSEILRQKKTAKISESNPEISDLIILYKYVFLENLEAYIARSADAVKRASDPITQRYLLWMELATVYGENLKHLLRHEFLSEASDKNAPVGIFATFQEKFQSELSAEEKKLSLQQEERIRRTFENDRIADKFAVLKKQTLAMFKSNISFEDDEQEEFLRSIEEILEPVKTETAYDRFMRLVPQLFALRERYRNGSIRELRRFFNRDIFLINGELAKYEPCLEEEERIDRFGRVRQIKKTAKTRKVRSFIMKTKESANARMGAHLCIAGDTTMFRNRDYFELITKDEETGKCVGVTLLLTIERDDGEKYLWFGPNPFESFLHKVSAEQCYRYLYETVCEFASTNGFDGVVVPEENQIVGACTNRHGEFPELIKKSILRDAHGLPLQVDFGKEVVLSRGQFPFSYSKGLLIWKRKADASR